MQQSKKEYLELRAACQRAYRLGRKAAGLRTAIFGMLAATMLVAVASCGGTNDDSVKSQFHRIEVIRDIGEVLCPHSGSGYHTSHPVIHIPDGGYYALGKPGEAVVFLNSSYQCRIGLITDETLDEALDKIR